MDSAVIFLRRNIWICPLFFLLFFAIRGLLSFLPSDKQKHRLSGGVRPNKRCRLFYGGLFVSVSLGFARCAGFVASPPFVAQLYLVFVVLLGIMVYYGNRRLLLVMRILAGDLERLREIDPRKSVMNFTDEEVFKTAAFEKLFFDELNNKSPYVRRLHDWRESEDTAVGVVEVEDMGKTIDDFWADVKRKTDNQGNAHYVIRRGDFVNRDTGYVINVGMKGFKDTRNYMIINKHRGYDITATANLVYCIPQIIENAVLLDTTTSDKKANKSPDGVFMHIFYAPFMFQGKSHIARCAVQEICNALSGERRENFYNLRGIKTAPSGRTDFSGKEPAQPVIPLGADYTVSQLFAVVKAIDENYYTNSRSMAQPD
jgi:hypothetical protein